MYSCTLFILNQFYLFNMLLLEANNLQENKRNVWLRTGILNVLYKNMVRIREANNNALVSSMCYKYMVLLKADNPQENKWASKQIKQTEKRRLAPTSVPL